MSQLGLISQDLLTRLDAFGLTQKIGALIKRE